MIVARRPEAVAQRQPELVAAHRQRHDRAVEEHEVRARRGAGSHRLLVPHWPRRSRVSR